MQAYHTLEEAEAVICTWLREGTGLSLVIQPGDQGEEKSEHVVFQLINDTVNEYTDSETRETDDGLIEHCIISDHLVTYQVAIHHCRDSIAKLRRLKAFLSSGVWRRTLDTVNLNYQYSNDINRTSFVIKGVTHWQTLMDVTFFHRRRECFPYQSIESVPLEICSEAQIPFPDSTVEKP